MGAVVFTIEGKTEREVEKELAKKLREVSHIPLYEDYKSPTVYDENSQLFRAVLRVHT